MLAPRIINVKSSRSLIITLSKLLGNITRSYMTSSLNYYNPNTFHTSKIINRILPLYVTKVSLTNDANNDDKTTDSNSTFNVIDSKNKTTSSTLNNNVKDKRLVSNSPIPLVVVAARLRRVLASKLCRRRLKKLDVQRSHLRRLIVEFSAEQNIKQTFSNVTLRELLYLGDAGAVRSNNLDEAPRVIPLCIDAFEKFVLASIHSASNNDESDSAHRVKNATSDSLLRELADMRLPHEWYGLARTMKRKIIMHLGPTNSGKTYSALQHLRQSHSGVYCGPLRLLAWEVYDKLNAHGVPCNLLTGQELVMNDANHTACTVEMTDTTRYFDCAVIDEAQMMGNPSRGHAFTRALLGVAASTVHLCGDASSLEIVREIVELIGDELEVKQYTRLGELSVADAPLKSLKEISRGDCIIAFSRREIHRLRDLIQSETGLKVCVVYGSLPPSTRQEQAKLFNESDNGYDVLVASDAIGQGLNLNIGRIIFSSLEKFDGFALRPLTCSEVLQIAGRAGRYSSAEFGKTGGVVTCLRSGEFRNDIKFLRKRMAETPPVLYEIGLYPTFENLEAFAQQHPHLSFVELLAMFRQYSTLDGMYFMSNCIDDHVEIASSIQHLPLDLSTRYKLCMAPAGKKDDLSWLIDFAEQLVHRHKVYVELDVPNTAPRTSQDMQMMEQHFGVFELYIWLAHRFPDEFVDVDQAIIKRSRLQELILIALKNLSTITSGAKKSDDDDDNNAVTRRGRRRMTRNSRRRRVVVATNTKHAVQSTTNTITHKIPPR